MGFVVPYRCILIIQVPKLGIKEIPINTYMRLCEFGHSDPNASIKDVDQNELSRIGEILRQKAPTASALFMDGKTLYRGQTRYRDDFYIQKSPSERIPLNTRAKFQIIIDKCLGQEGFKALRHNSFFCSGDIYQAATYGYGSMGVYITFPFDPFVFTWSSIIHDLYADIHSDEFYRLEDDFKLSPERASTLFVHNYGFHNSDNLEAAIKSENEIYIHGTCAFVHVGLKDKLKAALR